MGSERPLNDGGDSYTGRCWFSEFPRPSPLVDAGINPVKNPTTVSTALFLLGWVFAASGLQALSSLGTLLLCLDSGVKIRVSLYPASRSKSSRRS